MSEPPIRERPAADRPADRSACAGSIPERPLSGPARTRFRQRRLVLASGWLLVALCIAWEWWLAPLRPGGSLLMLKVAPLLLLLPAMARSLPRAYQWTTLIILLYACEGVVRAASEPSPVRPLAVLELVLASTIYVGSILWLRAGRPPRTKRNGDSARRS